MSFLSEDLLHYFRNIEQVLDESSDENSQTEATSLALLQNVFSECGEVSNSGGDEVEYRLTCHNDTSRTLEKLIRFSKNKCLLCHSRDQVEVSRDFENIVRVFGLRLFDRFVQISKNRFGSHVLESLLICLHELVPIQEDSEASDIPTCLDIILRIHEELSEAWQELFSNVFASHVIKRLIAVLYLVTPLPSIASKSAQRYREDNLLVLEPDVDTKPIPNEPKLRLLVREIACQLVKSIKDDNGSFADDIIKSLPFNPCSSSVLQMLIKVENMVRSETYIVSMIESCFPLSDSGYLGLLAVDPVGCRLLQSFLSCGQVTRKLAKGHFLKHSVEYAMHPVANYLIQELVSSRRIVRSLRRDSSFHINQYSVNVIDKLKSKDVWRIIKKRFPDDHLNGLILLGDEMPSSPGLKLFGKFINDQESTSFTRIRDHFPEIDKNVLLSWAYHHVGSRVLETFFNAPTIPLQMKGKVIRSVLLPNILAISSDKYGSHVVEAGYNVSDPYLKKKFMESLVVHSEVLRDSTYGRMVLKRCKVEDFKRRPKWSWYNNAKKLKE